MNTLLKSGLLASALLLSTQANANLVINGSFEDPDIPTGSWSVLNPAPGWTIGQGSGLEIRDNKVGTAYAGDQFAELDSHNNSSIMQTLSTVSGQSYSLSFAYAGRIGQSATTNNIQVFWNGSLLQDITAAGGASHNWTVYNFVVNGTGSDELKFLAAGTNDSYGGSLDAISVTASVSAVPVPAALPLMASALGMFGIARRRS